MKLLEVRRAILLMGPRRVGKTALLRHLVRQLLKDGVAASRICYLSVDHPLYNGLGLEQLFLAYCEAANVNERDGPLYVLYDEIQHLRDWEVHLKTLVDGHPSVRFVASGSAAAALRLKSRESGAGRFTDFLLPPLTFHEYVTLRGTRGSLFSGDGQRVFDEVSVSFVPTSLYSYIVGNVIVNSQTETVHAAVRKWITAPPHEQQAFITI